MNVGETKLPHLAVPGSPITVARNPTYGEIVLADTITGQPVRTAAPLRAWYLVASAGAFAVMTAAILSPTSGF